MSFWTAVVVIFAIATFAWLRAQKYRSGQQGDGKAISHSADPELEREVEKLRERIAVLERIATDERQTHDIAREIESLRD
ncbi:hypothetical protein GCM10011371_13420 [Novosphingobium marinum]|uniref:Phage shock protein B n=1 Tax=Novosphingobium marinum TaxID=1514948 RepID=A0A7Z0BVK6_9SPHN|nr:hypothetical protein [Novosphingobium marinum]NYH95450.1 hypothetical protein [Novosphingobium marinum]GGC27165.1 hypothetical protein GCM10011371_13420 [Novosphingobium marinum]